MALISAAEIDFGQRGALAGLFVWGGGFGICGSGLSGFGFGRAMRDSAKGAYSDEIRSMCWRGRARGLKDGSGRRKSARMRANARLDLISGGARDEIR